MPTLAYPPVRWNPFRLRGSSARLTLPPRTPEGSVLSVHLSDRAETSKVTLADVVDLFLRYRRHTVILYTDDPARTHADVTSHVEGPLPDNILLGVVATNQEEVNERTAAFDGGGPSVVLISPPRERINLSLGDKPHIRWVIAEGDSGEHSRPMHPHWVRMVRTQCLMYGTAFRFEGWGDWVENIVDAGDSPALHVPKDISRNHIAVHISGLEAFTSKNPYDPFDPYTVHETGVFGVDDGWTLMKRVGARDSGRAIDGREWDEAPLLDEL